MAAGCSNIFVLGPYQTVCAQESVYSLGDGGSGEGCIGSERTTARHRSISAELVEQATRRCLHSVSSFGGQQAPRHKHHIHHKQGAEIQTSKISNGARNQSGQTDISHATQGVRRKKCMQTDQGSRLQLTY